MCLDARHDGVGHVSIGVELLSDSYSGGRWSARIVLVVEAGEQLIDLAADLAGHLVLPAAG